MRTRWSPARALTSPRSIACRPSPACAAEASMSREQPRTLFDKVWESRVVTPETSDAPGLLYVDLHLIHEVTSPQAFSEIEARGLKVRRPDRTFGTLDHSTPTLPPD